jgi:hypothetical protein
MADLLQWNFKNINTKTPISKESEFSDKFYAYKASKLIWTNLLGKSTHEIQADMLFYNPNFLAFIETTNKDFEQNHTDLKKYPKIKKEDL